MKRMFHLAVVAVLALAAPLLAAYTPASKYVLTDTTQTVTGTKTFDGSGGLHVRAPWSANSGIFLKGSTGSGRVALIFGAGSYGFLDYDKDSLPSATAPGVRLSGYGPVIIGTNNVANYGSSSFTETARFFSGGMSLNGGTTITKIQAFTPTLTPASVDAGTSTEQSFAVTGLTTSDTVTLNPPAGLGDGLLIAGVRVSAADTLSIRFANLTAGSLTPGSGAYRVLAVRH